MINALAMTSAPPATNVSSPASEHRLLAFALLAYAFAAGLLSYLQAGYLNTDYIAYSGIARTLLIDPAASVSSYWSPMISWAVAPLLALGVDDLGAGRAVLVTAGFGYIAAVYVLARRLHPETGPTRRLFLTAALGCAVLHAAVWSAFLLDPDLIGAAFLYGCLASLFHPQLGSHWWRAFVVGIAAGLAYLGKAFMLPFLAASLPVAVLLAPRWRNEGAAPRSVFWRTAPWVALGALLVAGPWIAVLSAHCGHATFSTAGPANHANLGPANWRLDPLWRPPLEAGYIYEPHYGPDWSPLASWQGFLHQAHITISNVLRGLTHLAGWVLMVIAAMVLRAFARRTGVVPPLGRRLSAILIVFATAFSIYLAGYAWIDVERRYVVPALGPLLCLAALLIATTVGWMQNLRRPALVGTLLALGFGAQDVRYAYIAATRHSQSHHRSSYLAVKNALVAYPVLRGRFAASNWHLGLGVAYAGGNVPDFLGMPQAVTPEARARELAAAQVRFYLDFLPDNQNRKAPHLDHTWQRTVELCMPHAPGSGRYTRIDVYQPCE
jgi:hypothetical protein